MPVELSQDQLRGYAAELLQELERVVGFKYTPKEAVLLIHQAMKLAKNVAELTNEQRRVVVLEALKLYVDRCPRLDAVDDELMEAIDVVGPLILEGFYTLQPRAYKAAVRCYSGIKRPRCLRGD
jgi:hypothetical protein